MTMPATALQKVNFRTLKGKLSGSKRRPLASQKATFCNTIRNTLEINSLQNAKHK